MTAQKTEKAQSWEEMFEALYQQRSSADAPLKCGNFPIDRPTIERCNKPTEIVAISATDGGTMVWFPVCDTCAIENAADKGYALAYRYKGTPLE